MADDYAAVVASGHAWVAEHGDQLVGLLVMQPAEGHLLLENIAVAPSAQMPLSCGVVFTLGLVVGQDAGGGPAVFLAGPLVVGAVQLRGVGWPQRVIRSARVPGRAKLRQVDTVPWRSPRPPSLTKVCRPAPSRS
jgi:hypothetical protein